MKLCFIFLINLVPIISYSQISITPIGLTDTTQSILYIGADNPIKISNIGKQSMVSIFGGGTSLIKAENGDYIVRANAVTDDCYMLVTNNASGEILKRKQFKVRAFGEPEFNWKTGKIRKEMLIQNPFISMGIPGCYFKLNYRVLSFDAYLESEENSESFKINGNRFSTHLVEKLKNVEKGTVLTLDNIRVIGADDEFRQLFSIRIVLE